MSLFFTLLSDSGYSFSLSANSSAITSSSFTLSGTITETGSIYAVIVPNGSGQPSTAQILAGEDSGGNAAIRYAEQLNNTSFTFLFNGLASGIDFDVYAVGYNGSIYTNIELIEVSTVTADGLAYLTTFAKSYYDFSQLTGADASVITSVTDQGTLGIGLSDAAPVANPKIQYGQFSLNTNNLFLALPSNTTLQDDILLADTFGESWWKSDFEIIFTTMLTTSTDLDFFGVLTGTNIVRFNITTNAAAQQRSLRFEYRYSAATARRYIADTSSFFEANVRTGLRLFRIKCDFTNDVFKLWVDGVEIGITSVVDAFNLIDPTKWANATNKVTIGGYNAGGTITRYANPHYMSRFAITPIMTDIEAALVSEYMTQNL